VLPASLLPLLAGFAGSLNWIHALIFLVEGLVLWMAWRELSGRPEEIRLPVATLQDDPEPPVAAVRAAGRPGRVVSRLIVALATMLAVAGAVAAVYGAVLLSRRLRSQETGLVVAVALGPMLVLPMVLSGANLSRRGEGWVAATSGVGVVLLNLCLLLPAVILLWYPISVARSHGWNVPQMRMDWLREVSPLVYPLVTWRCDTVVLVLLGFVLLPAALGRWRLGRAEGVVLIALYGVYILMETAAGLSG